MDRVRVLCSLNRNIMLEFSQRTTRGLEQQSLFRLMLPAFQSFLEFNVNKEVQKDTLVIQHAASLHQAETQPTSKDTEQLLRQARQVDEKFLQQINPFPIKINIQYHDIENVRRQRIQLLLEESHRLLANWQSVRLQKAIHNLYDEVGFRQLLYKLLHLYSMETRSLSHSVRIPAVMGMMRDALTRSIYDVMDRVANDMATEIRGRFFPGAEKRT